MEQIFNDIISLAVPIAKNLLFAIIVFVLGFKVVNVISKRIKKGKSFKNIDSSAAGFLASFISISLKIIVVITVITILGVPMSSVIALIASAGVAIGLAVQGALSNLVGGMMILLFRPFRSGDYIEAEGVKGTVREISVFYTVIYTFDNRVITVPNGSLTNSVITNYSAEEFRRVDIEMTAGYESDIDVVKGTMLEVANSCENALKEPKPAAVMLECADHGIKYVLRVWCKTENYWTLREELLKGIRNSFKSADIDIPYPQLNVRIDK